MVQLYQLFYYLYKGVSLLVRTSGQSVVSHGRQQALSASPQGHFLLLPSDNSLLLKSIAVSEMMLPSDVQSPVEGPSDRALSVVASYLDQVLPNLISSQFRLQPWHQKQYVDFLFSFFFFFTDWILQFIQSTSGSFRSIQVSNRSIPKEQFSFETTKKAFSNISGW